jgi:hypothetical protein
MERKINPSLVDIVYLYDNKIVGFKEARNLLAAVFPEFITARDSELDDYMTMIEQREDESKSLEEEPPEPPDA